MVMLRLWKYNNKEKERKIMQKCYSCEKRREGSTVGNVYICYHCRAEEDAIGCQDIDDQLDRLGEVGTDSINHSE